MISLNGEKQLQQLNFECYEMIACTCCESNGNSPVINFPICWICGNPVGERLNII